jgi:hypothetical protein
VNDIEEGQLNRSVWVPYEIKKPEAIQYLETERTMNKYGAIRTIVIQSGGEKMRSAIYTNAEREELKAERVVELMCRRWGEENLIKELVMKHLINYTPGYVFESMEEQPLVGNPEVIGFKKQRAGYASELQKYKVRFADQIRKKGQEEADWDEIRETQLETLADISRLENEIWRIDQKIDPLAKQISYEEAHGGEKLLKLNYEKKRFLDSIKVFTYNMKQKMCEILLRYYGERKDVMSILAMIVERGGFVKLAGGRLKVRLRRFEDQEINYVARHLCEELTQMEPRTLDRYHFPIDYEIQQSIGQRFF